MFQSGNATRLKACRAYRRATTRVYKIGEIELSVPLEIATYAHVFGDRQIYPSIDV
jgi:hypothetical protein